MPPMQCQSRATTSCRSPRLDVLAQPERDPVASLYEGSGEVVIARAIHADGLAVGQAEDFGDGAGVEQVGGVNQVHTRIVVDLGQHQSYVDLGQREVPPGSVQRPGGVTREDLSLMPTVDASAPALLHSVAYCDPDVVEPHCPECGEYESECSCWDDLLGRSISALLRYCWGWSQ